MAYDLVYKFAEREEIYRLGELYKNVFNKEITTSNIKWYFIENPLICDFYYNFIAKSLTKEKKIVGHTAFIPINYTCRERLLRGALSVGSAVDPKYATIFPKLYNELEKRLIRDKFDFLFAFPNEKSLPFFLKLFKYSSHFFHYLQLNCHDYIKLNEDIDIGNIRKKVKNNIDETYVKWRVYNSPLYEYQIYDNPNFQIIYKLYNENEIDIILIKFKKNDFQPHYFTKFIERIKRTYRINMYSTNSYFSNIFMRMGFNIKNTPNNLVYKSLNFVLQEDSFFLQMIDSDIF